MYHKSHPFEMCSSVNFTMLTEICNHHHCVILQYFLSLSPAETVLSTLAVSPHSPIAPAPSNH